MDAQRASGAPLFIDLGGTRRRFSRLSRRAVCELIAGMPPNSEEERRWYSVFDLQRWSSTPEGSVAVLARASGEDSETVLKWGSEVTRSTAAGVIVAESCLTGEEPEGRKGGKPEGEHRPDFRGTTQTKRTTSRSTRRGLGILGRLRRRSGTRRSSASVNS